jgi:hypothetical protein
LIDKQAPPDVAADKIWAGENGGDSKDVEGKFGLEERCQIEEGLIESSPTNPS